MFVLRIPWILGTIGWIGLIIPHLGRLCVGSDNTKMIPCAMMMGGLFLPSYAGYYAGFCVPSVKWK